MSVKCGVIGLVDKSSLRLIKLLHCRCWDFAENYHVPAWERQHRRLEACIPLAQKLAELGMIVDNGPILELPNWKEGRKDTAGNNGHRFVELECHFQNVLRSLIGVQSY